MLESGLLCKVVSHVVLDHYSQRPSGTERISASFLHCVRYRHFNKIDYMGRRGLAAMRCG